MTKSMDQLRREAKALGRACTEGDADALLRVRAVLPAADRALKHAQALHVIARETGFASWPALKAAAEARGLDHAAAQGRLRRALFHGEALMTGRLLAERPDLAAGDAPLLVALYDVPAVAALLARDPDLVRRPWPQRGLMCHLAFSRFHQIAPERAGQAVEMAALLAAHGGDVNESFRYGEGEHALSALYGAIGHARHLGLARWLLDHGADPNDGESLYHATEFGSPEAVALLLAHGARTAGTNALPRALDFGDIAVVRLLLEAGADPNEGVAPHPSGEPSFVIPALHQAARRMAPPGIAELLLDHGADPQAKALGHTPYALARVHGNRAMADLLEARGAAPPLSDVEAQLARAAEDSAEPRDWIDMAALTPELGRLLCRLVGREGALPHMRRLVAMGFDPNITDEMDLPPVHLAGWEGLPEVMRFFLECRPDLSHVNGFGGSLLSTILHGSENCPQRATRDHIACARMALEHGVALPKRAPDLAAQPDMAAFLADWAEDHPGQVVAHGVV
jgi:ankyrin repeat protein